MSTEEANNLSADDKVERELLINTTPENIIDAFYMKKAELLSTLIKRTSEGVLTTIEDSDSSYLLEKIAQEIMTGMGQNLVITGKQGSGKSGAAVRTAEDISKITGIPFHVYKHLVFTPAEMLKLVTQKDKFPPGSIVIFDEVGLSLNTRDSMQKGNKTFTKFLQTIRKRSILAIFTLPNLNFFDKQAKDCLHYWFETDKRTDVQVVVKPKTVKQMQQTGNFYYPFPFVNNCQLRKLNIKKPSARNWNKYQEIEDEFKDSYALSTLYELLEMSEDEDNADAEDYYKYKDKRDEGYIQKLIIDDLGIPGNRATKYEKLYRRTLIVENRTAPPINDISKKYLADARAKTGRKKDTKEESKETKP